MCNLLGAAITLLDIFIAVSLALYYFRDINEDWDGDN